MNKIFLVYYLCKKKIFLYISNKVMAIIYTIIKLKKSAILIEDTPKKTVWIRYWEVNMFKTFRLCLFVYLYAHYTKITEDILMQFSV